MTRKLIRSVEDLVDAGLSDATDAPRLKHITEKYSLLVSRHMSEVVAGDNADGPVRRQFVPDVLEAQTAPDELEDPIGDAAHTVSPGLVHRYRDRALFKVIQTCPVYCRFCFRREAVGPGKGSLTDKELEQAYRYIKEHEELWEVILSGGDPLVLSPRRLGEILYRLRAISHVRVVRFHTRVPVVSPETISPDLIRSLSQFSPVYVVLHINSASELTQASSDAIESLSRAGVVLLSQTVLLKGVNDSVEALESLFRSLVERRIKPYYLHHLDRAPGTSHFRVPLRRGQQLMAELRQRVSGVCQPTYVLDVPGGFGKVPIGPCYVDAPGARVKDIHGEWHHYQWENP